MGNVEIVVISFFASLGFAIFFQIMGKDLLLAGLGGALTRCVYLLLTSFIDSRIIFVLFAALFASCYGEFLGAKLRVPPTYFIYPSIIPLIPADLFYYAMVGLVKGDAATVISNSIECALSLFGLSIGFVLSTTVVYYAGRRGN
ncbi:MAG: threonine/serine exporter family protein [Lachnospiraceae bacterium]|nr:threonine/serine exporter family protein [Lachnospiraceae bacterium]